MLRLAQAPAVSVALIWASALASSGLTSSGGDLARARQSHAFGVLTQWWWHVAAITVISPVLIIGIPQLARA
jgi:hypothetical protein